MRRAGIVVVALGAGCASGNWHREIVDAGGVHATAALHVDGSQKTLTIVHSDPASGRLRAARRTGTGAGWGAFSKSTIAGDHGRFPALSLAPDGTVWIAYVTGPLPKRGTLMVAHYDPVGPGPGDWTAETIEDVFISERPTIAYLPKTGVDELHVVISTHPDRILRHWTRKLDETEWKRNDLPAGLEGSADPEGKGLQPRLLRYGPTPSLGLFYGQGADGTPLVDRVSLGGEAFTVDSGGEQMRFAVGVVMPAAAADSGKVAVVRASCAGKPTYRVSKDEVPHPNWHAALTPPVPEDPARSYCDPSFAHDGAGFLYLAAYDMQARAPVAFIYNTVAESWRLEFIDGGPDDQGHDTTTVYDPLAFEILVAWRDATNGNLELATRAAN